MMDIISYGTASKASKEENKTRNEILGEGVKSTFPTMKHRIDAIDSGIGAVVAQADNLIIKNAVNIMKANAKLNALAKTKKYKMHNMLFDDLLDLSGIDVQKSKYYTHDSTLGEITALETPEPAEGEEKELTTITTITESVDIIPKKVIVTVEEESSSSDSIIPNMISNDSPSPYVANASEEVGIAFEGFKGPSYRWATSSRKYPAWISIDLGKPQEVYKYHIGFPNTSTRRSGAANHWQFQGSNDNVNWETLDERNNEGLGYFELNKTKPYRYYRFYILANKGDSWLQVSDIKMYVKSNSNIGNYYVSRGEDKEGNAIWESIIPNTLYYFHDTISPEDKKLKLKIELPSGTKLLNYALTWA